MALIYGTVCGTPSQVHASETPRPPPMAEGHHIAKVLVIFIDAEAEFDRAGNAASERLGLIQIEARTGLRYGSMDSMSFTNVAAVPKNCADHFLIKLPRSFGPRRTTGIRRASEAGSIKDRKVALPIFRARPACVSGWWALQGRS